MLGRESFYDPFDMSFNFFLHGAAKVIDLGNTLQNPVVEKILNTTDEEAIQHDFDVVFGRK